MDSTTGVNFDENGIRRPIEYMQTLGIDMQTERYAVYRHRPTKTADGSIPDDFLYIRHYDESADGGIRSQNRRRMLE